MRSVVAVCSSIDYHVLPSTDPKVSHVCQSLQNWKLRKEGFGELEALFKAASGPQVPVFPTCGGWVGW